MSLTSLQLMPPSVDTSTTPPSQYVPSLASNWWRCEKVITSGSVSLTSSEGDTSAVSDGLPCPRPRHTCSPGASSVMPQMSPLSDPLGAHSEVELSTSSSADEAGASSRL